MGYFKFGSDGKDVGASLQNSFVGDPALLVSQTGGQIGISGTDSGSASGIFGDNTNGLTYSRYVVEPTTKGVNWNQICMGTNNTLTAGGGQQWILGVKTDGTLWGWGSNLNGQLGINVAATKKSTPVQIAGTNWKKVYASTTIKSTLFNYSAGIKTDGTLWMWGENTNGCLGDGTTVTKSSPVQVSVGGQWKKVALGDGVTYGIKSDGTLWSWGKGILGDGSAASSVIVSTPIQISAASWKDISAGANVYAGIKSDGTLWTWGNNSDGQLGTGDRSTKLSPVQTLAGGNDWKQVSFGSLNLLALKNNGSLWSCGNGTQACLGDGTLISKSSPVQVLGGNKWVKIMDTNTNQLAAMANDGSIYTWGYFSDNSLVGVNDWASGTASLYPQARVISSGAGEFIYDYCISTGASVRLAV